MEARALLDTGPQRQQLNIQITPLASFRVFSLGIGSSKGELQVVNLLSVATLVWYCFAKRKDLFAYLHLWKDHKCKGVYGIGYRYFY